MKALLSICLLSGLAVAQMAPPSQKVAGGSPMQMKKPTATMTARKPAAKNAQPAMKASMKASVGQGKRDPFTSPIREGGASMACTTGKQCLAIDSIVLRGIVVAQQGPIAVVESSSRKVTYFSREKDPVFNGYVVKITPDSILFRENVMDRTGRTSTRDVVKKVNAPVV